jgi:hypothetical protein
MRKAYIDLELESEINSDIHTVKIIYILDKDDEIPETISSYNIDILPYVLYVFGFDIES